MLFGGLDCARVARLTGGEVERHSRAVPEDRREEPRFVLGTSGPDVVRDTPPKNLQALRRAIGEAAAQDD